MGNLLLAGREITKAQDEAKLVLSKDPNNADAHALLANAHAVLGNQAESLKELGKAIQLAPDRSQFQRKSGLVRGGVL